MMKKWLLQLLTKTALKGTPIECKAAVLEHQCQHAAVEDLQRPQIYNMHRTPFELQGRVEALRTAKRIDAGVRHNFCNDVRGRSSGKAFCQV